MANVILERDIWGFVSRSKGKKNIASLKNAEFQSLACRVSCRLYTVVLVRYISEGSDFDDDGRRKLRVE